MIFTVCSIVLILWEIKVNFIVFVSHLLAQELAVPAVCHTWGAGYSSRDGRGNFRKHISTHINVHMTGIFSLLSILTTLHTPSPGDNLRRSIYHHFSKTILSFGSPKSMRVFEIASIMGGGPQRKHKVLCRSTRACNSSSASLPPGEIQVNQLTKTQCPSSRSLMWDPSLSCGTLMVPVLHDEWWLINKDRRR